MTSAQPHAGPFEPFAGLTGRGVRIAVIDSGVNLGHSHIRAKTHGIAIEGISEDAVDNLGHGTAVIAAIQDKAPDSEYFAIKLFGASLRTTTPSLIQSLEWAIDKGVDIINLSLGTPNFDYRPEFEALVNRATRAGTIVVSARSAMEKPVLPGCLRGVFSVDVDWELQRDTYRIVDGPDGLKYFGASGFPRSLPGVPQRRNLHGISFAVANMTGFVARACELNTFRDFAEICHILSAELLRIRP